MGISFSAVTFTNFGYKDFTHNLLKSISKNKVNLNPNVFALDVETYDYFKKFHQNVTLHDNQTSQKEFVNQKSENFGDMMMNKFEIIYKSLQNFDYVLYIDGDIVIKKDITETLFKFIQHKDILFQDDKRPSKPNMINLCAGFMLIKSNKKMLKFFNPQNIPLDKFNKLTTHDQTYINKSRAKFNYNVLPLNHFPNGPHYYSQKSVPEPYIIHFNYLLGMEKKAKMQEYGEWYI